VLPDAGPSVPASEEVAHQGCARWPVWPLAR
jgi:hypothetical protein